MNLSFNILKISVWHQCCSGHQLDLLRQHLRWKVITDDVQDIKSRLYTGCSIKIVCFFLQFTATHSSPSVYRRWDLHCSERYANVCTVTPIAYLPAIKYKAICLSSWSSHQVCSFILHSVYHIYVVFICMFVYTYIYLSIYQFINQSIVILAICLSIFKSLHLFI